MSELPVTSSLLPPSATALERATAHATARLSALPTPLAPLWRPDQCPAELLPWLAWSLSLDTWKPYWSEAVKRQRIRQAIPTHRRRGTAAAVRATVESFGAGVALREWWQTEPPGTPHTFTLLLTVRDATNAERLQADIVREVERVKPARSHFTLVAGLTASGGLGAKAVARPVVARRLAFIATHEDAA